VGLVHFSKQPLPECKGYLSVYAFLIFVMLKFFEVTRRALLWPLGCALLLMVSCKPKEEATGTSATRAFYFWQTDLDNFDWDDSLYQSMKVRKIYYRLFDVGWNEAEKAPIPVSPLTIYYNHYDTAASVVPVVFIANETFKNIDTTQSIKLAHDVHRKIMSKLTVLLMDGAEYFWTDRYCCEYDPYQITSARFDEQQKYDSLYAARMKSIIEVQFDCDWTTSTRQNYFTFLRAIKKLFTTQRITSTIRLYQYKYPKKAGVPPVDRGMLMCYNAGNVKDPDAHNSIFDKPEVMSYLKADPYPLPLDYALPVFEWALLYHNGQLQHILSSSILRGEYSRSISNTAENRWVVNEDFVYGYDAGSIFIRNGDEIRFESPAMDDVQAVARFLSEHKNNPEAILCLYHLNEYDLEKNANAIQTVFRSF